MLSTILCSRRRTESSACPWVKLSSAVMREPTDGLMVLPLGADAWDEAALLDMLGPTF
jgi:hypothetical protein